MCCLPAWQPVFPKADCMETTKEGRKAGFALLVGTALHL